MRPSDRAWITLGIGVLAWDKLCADGETLSEAVDRYLDARRWITHAIVAAFALHLCNWLPGHIDPIALLARRRKH